MLTVHSNLYDREIVTTISWARILPDSTLKDKILYEKQARDQESKGRRPLSTVDEISGAPGRVFSRKSTAYSRHSSWSTRTRALRTTRPLKKLRDSILTSLGDCDGVFRRVRIVRTGISALPPRMAVGISRGDEGLSITFTKRTGARRTTRVRSTFALRGHVDAARYPVQTVVPKKATLENIKMLASLKQCEPEVPQAMGGEGGGGGNSLLQNAEPELRVLTVLSDLYDREIVTTISWAKQVPGFTDLTLNDQMRILQATWAEVLTLTMAYRSVNMQGRLVFGSDFTLDEKQARDQGALDLFQPCMQMVERLDRTGLLKEEYCLLKALVLVNADTRIEDYQGVKKLCDSILTSLGDCVGVLRPTSTGAQLNHILLRLPILRQADLAMKRFWLNVRREGKVNMNKLFIEMLEAHFR